MRLHSVKKVQPTFKKPSGYFTEKPHSPFFGKIGRCSHTGLCSRKPGTGQNGVPSVAFLACADPWPASPFLMVMWQFLPVSEDICHPLSSARMSNLETGPVVLYLLTLRRSAPWPPKPLTVMLHKYLNEWAHCDLSHSHVALGMQEGFWTPLRPWAPSVPCSSSDSQSGAPSTLAIGEPAISLPGWSPKSFGRAVHTNHLTSH